MSSLTIFRIVLLGLAFSWLAYCSVSAAQRLDEWNRLRTDVQGLNEKQQAFELKIEPRLVRLETNLEMISRLVWGVVVAVGGQLLQAGIAMFIAARRLPPRRP